MYYLWMDLLTHPSVLARLGYALSDPTRATVLLALREAPAYPSDLAEQAGVSRQSLSNHLACLRGCGLVDAVPEGRRVRYELSDAKLGEALSALLAVVAAGDAECFCTTGEDHPNGTACCR
jgi:DNA-binding transcriptional ArsR family regulator